MAAPGGSREDVMSCWATSENRFALPTPEWALLAGVGNFVVRQVRGGGHIVSLDEPCAVFEGFRCVRRGKGARVVRATRPGSRDGVRAGGAGAQRGTAGLEHRDRLALRPGWSRFLPPGLGSRALALVPRDVVALVHRLYSVGLKL